MRRIVWIFIALIFTAGCGDGIDNVQQAQLSSLQNISHPNVEVSLQKKNEVRDSSVDTVFLKKKVEESTGFNGYFGEVVAIDGDIAVVGAPRENSFQGAIYIFEKNYDPTNPSVPLRDNWGLRKKIVGATSSGMGNAVAVDGNRIAIGIGRKLEVRILEKDEGGTNNWGTKKVLSVVFSPEDFLDSFGDSVDLLGDTLVTAGKGQVFVFNKDNGGVDTWGLVKILKGDPPATSRSTFGDSLALHEDILVVGDYEENHNQGSVYVFEKDYDPSDPTVPLVNNWGLRKKTVGSPDSQFGKSISLFHDEFVVGSTMMDGSIFGKISFFRQNYDPAHPETPLLDNWGEIKSIEGEYPTYSWIGTDVSLESEVLLSGGSDSFYVFFRNEVASDNWVGKQTIRHEQNSRFGAAVAISGDIMIVGEYGTNSAYIYSIAPTDITLSENRAEEGNPVGTVVGTLSTTGFFPEERYSYSFVAGSGDEDNASFTIDGGVLKTAITFDYSTKNSYSIRVKTTDENGGFFEKILTVAVVHKQTISFDDISAHTYGDADFTLAATATSGLTVSYTSSNNGVATVFGSTVTIVGAGTTTITASQSGSVEWYTAPDVAKILTVNQAVLTVTADDQTRNYGDPNPPFTISYDGFKLSDDSTVLDSEPTASTTAGLTTLAGEYDIVVTGGSDVNYSFSYESGTLTIFNRAPKVQTSAADNITQSSVELSGIVEDHGGLAVSERGICISHSENPTISSVCTKDAVASTGAFSLVFSTLSEATSYHYRAYATNSVGTDYGDDKVFTTAAYARIPAQTLFVDENAVQGTVVGVVSTVGLGANPAFTITSGNTDTLFSIDAATGTLSVQNSASLDFETIHQLLLGVSAEDGAGLVAKGVVTININNLNDNIPEISQQVMSVNELAHSGAFVGKVVAHDADNDSLSYAILMGNPDSVFSIESSSGNITVANADKLDFTVTNQYTLTVEVFDGKSTAHGSVVINVVKGSGVCEKPELITSLPYEHTGDTQSIGNLLEQYGAQCGDSEVAEYFYPSGEFVYALDLAAGESIDISLDGEGGFDPRLLLLTTCAEQESCVGYGIGNGGITLSYTASKEERIFIVIEGESAPPTTEYTLKIREAEESDDADMLEDEDATNVDQDEQSADEDISSDSDTVVVDEDTLVTDDDTSVTDENELDADSNDSDESSDDDILFPPSKSSSGCSCSLI